MTTNVSGRLNILCIMFKIRAFFVATLFARLWFTTCMWKTFAWGHHCNKKRGFGPYNWFNLTIFSFMCLYQICPFLQFSDWFWNCSHSGFFFNDFVFILLNTLLKTSEFIKYILACLKTSEFIQYIPVYLKTSEFIKYISECLKTSEFIQYIPLCLNTSALINNITMCL